MTVIPQAKKIVLPNGLRIVSEEIPAMRSVSMGILAGVGSGSETPKEAGLSHYIEHMMFKGTKKRSAYEIAHALDSIGGKMNAYTSKETTVYYAVVLDKHIDIQIDVLCDMVLGSLFDPKEMEVEKGVILEEIKMYEDTPDELIHDYFAEKILHGHPLGQPTIGHAASVKAMKRENIVDYISRFYSPKNMVISLAGAIPGNVVDLLKPYFEKYEGKEVALKQPQPDIKGVVSLKKKKTEQTHLCLGTKGPSQLDDDRFAFAILDNIMGGSMSSHLFQEVREKRGLAYAIYSTSSPFRDFGIAYTYAGISHENLVQVVDLILNEFKRMKKEGLTQAELERAKEYMKGTTVLGLESTSSRMSYIMRSEFYYNRIITIDEVFDKIDKVTNDDIVRLANQYFIDQYLTLAVIGDFEELPIKEIHC
ncbi:MAG: pitrilysin family protein [Candidatus Margulisbacteria bacterium]|nr:pitrilysin family protein [Candidatus Margulisiibacteriota bacterium]